MDELRVPTVRVVGELLSTDGTAVRGCFFIPASSPHAGPMRPEEWLNGPARFFPFLPEGNQRPILINKQTVVVITVPADTEPDEMEVEVVQRVVRVECAGRSLEGRVRLEMPQNQQRVLDFLNRAEMFLCLREGERQHLVQKHHIHRVTELSGS